MPAATSSDLVAQLRLYHLLEPAQLEEVEAKLLAQFPEPKLLAKELIKRGWLTAYQANQLFQGRGKGLVLGSYILVDRLGGGGMGDVFKARNWKMGTTFALKVIRKDRIADKGAMQRFRREIHAAAQLTHPNIVHAYDAEEVDGTLGLAMEYVEGTDLAKLVKVHGPLPIDQACDFIRQAACGLQHAFERGMVHRDIKPHNLLLTVVRGSLSGAGEKESAKSHDGPPAPDHGQIKILDMGLARLAQVNDDSASTSSMTQEGAILGTPDYIAPEQARESHTVDIRADLYSLGCTFYFLLTGSVPFPKGSLIQKLTKHQFDEPLAVEKLRAEVPEHVGAIVRMLMAKLPEDRFQTPGELIDALAGEFPVSSETTRTMTQAVANASAASSTVAGAGKSKSGDTDAHWSSIVTPQITMKSTQISRSPSVLFKNPRLWIWSGGGVLGLGLLLFVSWLIWGGSRQHVQEMETVKNVTPPPVIAKEKADGASTKQGTEIAINVPKTVPTVPEVDPSKNKKPPAIVPVPKADATQIKPGPEIGVPKGAVWKTSAALDAWCREVAALKPNEQVAAVAAELKKRNPGFNGLISPQIFKETITALDMQTDKIVDLAPVRALTGLKRLSVAGSSPGKGQLVELGPLQGLPIVYLNADFTKVADLTPLRTLPLEYLYLAGAPATDLTPLRGLSLKDLRWNFVPQRDLEILRSFPTLEKINGTPAADFWKKVGGAALKK